MAVLASGCSSTREAPAASTLDENGSARAPEAAAAGAGEGAALEDAGPGLAAFMASFEREAEPPPAPPTAEDAGTCPARGKLDRDVGILMSPRRPAVGRPSEVLTATLDGGSALAVRVEVDGQPVELETEAVHRLGMPVSTRVRFVPPSTGRVQVIVGRDGEGLRCLSYNVRSSPYEDKEDFDFSQVWGNDRAWTASEEALYSAWVRELFHGDPDQDLAWKALSEVTSDPQRNVLHDFFGRGEDDPKVGMELVPDCADTPYFLRAYYAYKRGLPFGFRKCSRGRGKPPVCFDLRTNLDPADRRVYWYTEDELSAHAEAEAAGEVVDPLHDKATVPETNEIVEYFFRRSIGWGVHTGNGRCAYGDSSSDLYPVKLDARGLRPGTVYADPYGHILVLAELVAPRGSRPGILFAVDGQPDGSITRKRFWEGNFLWNQDDESLGGSGFKAFRPLTVVGEPGSETLVQITDETIAQMRSYGDVSDMQRELSPLEFYDLMERLITPGERSPFEAQAELVAALAEAVRVRVTSVANGVAWHEDNPEDLVEMPWGHAVFETSGPWENYSTPARDLRLLIAMDVVLGFKDKVERNPAAFGLDPEGDPERFAQALRYLEEQRADLLADPKYDITYVRSDGSEWTLGLDEVVARAGAFEQAYNPNDCPEVRWGAPADSEEAQTCDRRAPDGQAIKMRYYRTWFTDRRRPARGDEGPDIPELAEEQAAWREAKK
ncbi:hypothetical protein [Plesiocystis pacifica]|nr:hypothetical protein [Plesiocystis pacifica]